MVYVQNWFTRKLFQRKFSFFIFQKKQESVYSIQEISFKLDTNLKASFGRSIFQKKRNYACKNNPYLSILCLKPSKTKPKIIWVLLKYMLHADFLSCDLNVSFVSSVFKEADLAKTYFQVCGSRRWHQEAKGKPFNP